jgi:hypothetical protein
MLGELWGRYLCLGGRHPQSALADYLSGAAVWSDAEHNVLAQALNEGLWDTGLPSLAPQREPGAAREAAPGTPRPSP